MDNNTRQLLEQAGIDVAEALERFMGSEALLLKFLRRFPEDENFRLLRQAIVSQDLPRAFEAAHTLKGVAGNLSMKVFYQQVSQLVEHLRAGHLAAAAAEMAEVEAQYTKITAALSQLE